VSVREFAEERGLSPWSLYGWRSKIGRGARGRRKQALRRSGRPARAEELVAVEIVGREGPGDPGKGFELELGGGMLVRIPPGFDESELRRLISAVRSWC